MLDLAIVGGGPGGLMSAWYLRKKLGPLCRVTIFEASDRLGGKILTKKFETSPAMYEAGVAELYDYSMTGPDPLRELVQHFGLQTIPMDAEQVQLDGALLDDVDGMRRKYGPKTAKAIEDFRKLCTTMVSPVEYYEGVGAHDNEHPWAHITAEELLDREIEDAVAKRFIKVMARSDIATESHNTNGLNALKNYVMDIDGYIGLYSIQNGNEQLIHSLRSEIDADIKLNHRVLKVGKAPSGRYAVNMMNGKGAVTREFDLVLMCLPHRGWPPCAGGELLRRSMTNTSPISTVRRSICGCRSVRVPFGATAFPALVHVGAFGAAASMRRRAPRVPQRRDEWLIRLRRARLRQSQRLGYIARR